MAHVRTVVSTTLRKAPLLTHKRTQERHTIAMHIAFNAWFWDRTDTGSGQYLRQLVTHLRKLSPQTALSLIMPPHNPTPDHVPDGVTVIPTGDQATTTKLGKIWFEQRTFPQMVGKIGADIAHVPYWGSPLSCPVPIVVSVLDVIPLLYPIYAQGVANRLYLSLVSTSARYADHVITISQTSKLDIEEQLDIPKEKISVTYLAPDERFHPRLGAERDAQVRQKYGLPDRFLLYLGGFDRRKQVNELLFAYTFVKLADGVDAPLVIAGKEPTWDEGLFPNVKAYAETLGIAEDVQWLGFVPEEDKPSLYRMADVFVFPSEYEGFGLPPLEAMASGTPVIAFDTVIFDEILEDSAYLVEDARRMGGAMIALMIQDSFRETMSNQGLALATKYTWRKTAKATLAVYQQVVAK